MLLTPTYHVYEMYTVHHDADLLDFAMVTDKYRYEDQELNKINATISSDASGTLHMTLVNIDPNEGADVTCHIPDLGRDLIVSEGRVLTSDLMNTRNTFEAPETLKPVAFDDHTVNGDSITIHMPAKSVVVLSI